MICVVKQCSTDCPFFIAAEESSAACNISTPSKRPIPEMEGYKFPSFCPLQREQIIVRAFEED